MCKTIDFPTLIGFVFEFFFSYPNWICPLIYFNGQHIIQLKQHDTYTPGAQVPIYPWRVMADWMNHFNVLYKGKGMCDIIKSAVKFKHLHHIIFNCLQHAVKLWSVPDGHWFPPTTPQVAKGLIWAAFSDISEFLMRFSDGYLTGGGVSQLFGVRVVVRGGVVEAHARDICPNSGSTWLFTGSCFNERIPSMLPVCYQWWLLTVPPWHLENKGLPDSVFIVVRVAHSSYDKFNINSVLGAMIFWWKC